MQLCAIDVRKIYNSQRLIAYKLVFPAFRLSFLKLQSTKLQKLIKIFIYPQTQCTTAATKPTHNSVTSGLVGNFAYGQAVNLLRN